MSESLVIGAKISDHLIEMSSLYRPVLLDFTLAYINQFVPKTTVRLKEPSALQRLVL